MLGFNFRTVPVISLPISCIPLVTWFCLSKINFFQIMFIMTPGILPRKHSLLEMFTSHPLSVDHLVIALITTYIGKCGLK